MSAFLPGLTQLAEGQGISPFAPSSPAPVGSPVSSTVSDIINYPGNVIRGVEAMGHAAKATAGIASSIVKFFSDPATIITAILGLMLIAAGIFTHPAVREKIVEAGKAAAVAA